MVPILVGFVFHFPGFPGDRCSAFRHVLPTAIVVGGDERERLVGGVILEEGFAMESLWKIVCAMRDAVPRTSRGTHSSLMRTAATTSPST